MYPRFLYHCKKSLQNGIVKEIADSMTSYCQFAIKLESTLAGLNLEMASNGCVTQLISLSLIFLL
jgi:hypothetical protein